MNKPTHRTQRTPRSKYAVLHPIAAAAGLLMTTAMAHAACSPGLPTVCTGTDTVGIHDNASRVVVDPGATVSTSNLGGNEATLRIGVLQDNAGTISSTGNGNAVIVTSGVDLGSSAPQVGVSTPLFGAVNSGTISAENGVGIYTRPEWRPTGPGNPPISASDPIAVWNKDTGVINIVNGTGIAATGGVQNDGQVNVSTGTGINIFGPFAGVAHNGATGKITVGDGIGIQTAGITIVNDGDIAITGSNPGIGVYNRNYDLNFLTDRNDVNNGTISVANGIGMQGRIDYNTNKITVGKGTGINAGTFGGNTAGANIQVGTGIGINSGGKAVNNGIIGVQSGIGMNGPTGINQGGGVITVGSKSATGQQIGMLAIGATNDGNIAVQQAVPFGTPAYTGTDMALANDTLSTGATGLAAYTTGINSATGTISVAGEKATGALVGMGGSPSTVLNNDGTINATGPNSRGAVVLGSPTGQQALNNTGTITATGLNSSGAVVLGSTFGVPDSAVGAVTSTVNNSGTISGSGTGARGLTVSMLSDASKATITNSKTIEATGTNSVGIALNPLGNAAAAHPGAAITLTNQAGATISGAGKAIESGYGNITFSNFGQVNGDVALANSHVNTVLVDSQSQIAGNLDLGNTTASTLILDGKTDAIYSNVVTGNTRLAGTMIKRGNTTWTLDSDMPQHTGTTVIEAGKLYVNGAIPNAAVIVNPGTLLGGTGQTGGITIAGTVVPGPAGPGQIGTLTANGNVVFQPGSTFVTNVNAAGQAGLLTATGGATINGGTVQVGVIGDQSAYLPTTRYRLVHGDAGVSGQFSGLTHDFAFLSPRLTYDPNNVYLEFLRNAVSLDDPARTPNQKAVGANLNDPSVCASGRLNAVCNSILTLPRDQVPGAYDQLSGESYATLRRMALAQSSRFYREVGNRMQQRLSAEAHAQPATGSNGAGSRTGNSVVIGSPNKDGWLNAQYATTSAESDGNGGGYRSHNFGVIGGVDHHLNDKVVVGFAADVDQTNATFSDRNAKGKVTSAYAGGYVGYREGQFTATGVVGGGYHRYDMDRSPTFGNFAGATSGKGSGTEVGAYGELNYRLTTSGPASVEPFIAGQVIRFRNGGFTEGGNSGAELDIRGNSGTATMAMVGTRLGYHWMGSAGMQRVSATLAWTHENGAINKGVVASFAGAPGSPTYTVHGPREHANGAMIGLDYTGTVARNLELMGRVAARYKHDFSDHAFYAGLRYSW